MQVGGIVAGGAGVGVFQSKLFGCKTLPDLACDSERLPRQLEIVNGSGFGPFQNVADFMKAGQKCFDEFRGELRESGYQGKNCNENTDHEPLVGAVDNRPSAIG